MRNCAVLVDGKPVQTCPLGLECAGRRVETVEGMAGPAAPSAVEGLATRRRAARLLHAGISPDRLARCSTRTETHASRLVRRRQSRRCTATSRSRGRGVARPGCAKTRSRGTMPGGRTRRELAPLTRRPSRERREGGGAPGPFARAWAVPTRKRTRREGDRADAVSGRLRRAQHCKPLRSKFAHARIVRVDALRGARPPASPPGHGAGPADPRHPAWSSDERPLAPTGAFRGDPVAVAAASTKTACDAPRRSRSNMKARSARSKTVCAPRRRRSTTTATRATLQARRRSSATMARGSRRPTASTRTCSSRRQHAPALEQHAAVASLTRRQADAVVLTEFTTFTARW